MPSSTRLRLTLCLSATLCLALPAHADGFADLRAALARNNHVAPVKGQLQLESSSREGGEAAAADEERGQASVGFEDGPAGLRVQLPRDLLQRAEQEDRLREKDPNARTPALTALKLLDLRDLRTLTAPAPVLLSLLEQATPRQETAEAWSGQPARKLSYELGVSRLKEKDRKYIKKFDSRLDVWIGGDGQPLASRLSTTASGRAFVVVSFETSSLEETHYQRAGERLVVQRRERRNSGSGGGEKGDSRSVYQLQLLPG